MTATASIVGEVLRAAVARRRSDAPDAEQQMLGSPNRRTRAIAIRARIESGTNNSIYCTRRPFQGYPFEALPTFVGSRSRRLRRRFLRTATADSRFACLSFATTACRSAMWGCRSVRYARANPALAKLSEPACGDRYRQQQGYCRLHACSPPAHDTALEIYVYSPPLASGCPGRQPVI
jgi:hypothetical protein